MLRLAAFGSAAVVFVLMAGGMAGGQAQGGATGAAPCGPPDPRNEGELLSFEEVASLAYRAGFRGEDLVIATAVTEPESARVATKVGGPNTDGSYDYGLWQINGKAHPDLLAKADWKDPASNANMAYSVWRGAGWTAWTTYRNGAHLPFMPDARAAVAKLAAAGVDTGSVPTSSGAQAACDAAALASPDLPAADPSTLLDMPSVAMNSSQVADVQSGGIDPRVISILVWIGEHHSVVVTALRNDHPYSTKSGNVSNHTVGRAVDIGAVDGTVCNPYGPSDPCGRLLIELASITGPLKPTELIGSFDPVPGDPSNWAQDDHRDHIHVGWDG